METKYTKMPRIYRVGLQVSHFRYVEVQAETEQQAEDKAYQLWESGEVQNSHHYTCNTTLETTEDELDGVFVESN